MVRSQVWYCVSPADRRRFEDMAKQQFPDLARSCRAFLRHKDVLLSPRVLRSYNIQVVQARHASCWRLSSTAAAAVAVLSTCVSCVESFVAYLSDDPCVLLQAHQDSGEFIVLNAGAYHSGYNQVPSFVLLHTCPALLAQTDCVASSGSHAGCSLHQK